MKELPTNEFDDPIYHNEKLAKQTTRESREKAMHLSLGMAREIVSMTSVIKDADAIAKFIDHGTTT